MNKKIFFTRKFRDWIKVLYRHTKECRPDSHTSDMWSHRSLGSMQVHDVWLRHRPYTVQRKCWKKNTHDDKTKVKICYTSIRNNVGNNWLFHLNFQISVSSPFRSNNKRILSAWVFSLPWLTWRHQQSRMGLLNFRSVKGSRAKRPIFCVPSLDKFQW